MSVDVDIEKEVLKQIIGAVLDDSPGIYPKSWVGKYEKRTEYMEGWNDCAMRSHEIFCDILKDLGVSIFDGDNCIDSPRIEI